MKGGVRKTRTVAGVGTVFGQDRTEPGGRHQGPRRSLFRTGERHIAVNLDVPTRDRGEPFARKRLRLTAGYGAAIGQSRTTIKSQL